MKKYNLTKIMKRAWEIKKKAKLKKLSFSFCLKEAWKEMKIEMNTVKLTGSEKQIAWAEDIRKKMIAFWTSIMAKSHSQRALERKVTQFETLCKMEKASWFILNKDVIKNQYKNDIMILSAAGVEKAEREFSELLNAYAA